MILPHATVHESNFFFFSRGKEMWSTNQDFRYGLEDQLRIQLEQSDRLQGFSLTTDVSSGHASLTQEVIEAFCKDEAPKAPVLLYASEGSNPF